MIIEELAILNGNIITMDSKISKCKAVFVKNGRIERNGSDENIKKKMGGKMKVRSALIQMSCSENREENMLKATRMIEEAAEKGAKIVCLQELFGSIYFA